MSSGAWRASTRLDAGAASLSNLSCQWASYERHNALVKIFRTHYLLVLHVSLTVIRSRLELVHSDTMPYDTYADPCSYYTHTDEQKCMHPCIYARARGYLYHVRRRPHATTSPLTIPLLRHHIPTHNTSPHPHSGEQYLSCGGCGVSRGSFFFNRPRMLSF